LPTRRSYGPGVAAQHLQVVVRPHPQALRLEQLALGLQPREPVLQLDLD
jgi:hypothetical protein